MFNTVKVRQGAIVCHVHPDGKVEYELCIPVPKGVHLDIELSSLVHFAHHKSTRYVKTDLTKDLEMITYIKELVQLAVTEFKIAGLTERKNAIQSKHNTK